MRSPWAVHKCSGAIYITIGAVTQDTNGGRDGYVPAQRYGGGGYVRPIRSCKAQTRSAHRTQRKRKGAWKGKTASGRLDTHGNKRSISSTCPIRPR
ncbi:hypothetical protein GLOTRDRAFT_109918 [Gloeophyllum trabeum ATCC 11539]|uniref:Uncharacterized protein n=1 Tax=Gloeophyllum trabeum (strain ATCC 11539 / FP-39264 / Madison 617) TaxID=670483 RepID=S7RT26_GLOTA|nr:uncharacterized protein GLOTRDRAFT_109918 [Gloeophyllum trabeum ATCC 11539]EPQ57840.1 hypothetical protein GLOTRDRAFT_109918 [Gloeophyllum trabeum ATCC 11539]